jgi:hypothetical protein
VHPLERLICHLHVVSHVAGNHRKRRSSSLARNEARAPSRLARLHCATGDRGGDADSAVAKLTRQLPSRPRSVVAAKPPNPPDRTMETETIEVRVASSGQTLKVVVYNKTVERIEVVVGEGIHGVRCVMTPNRNGSAYVGNVRGREIVFDRSREQVKADMVRAAGFREFRR